MPGQGRAVSSVALAALGVLGSWLPCCPLPHRACPGAVHPLSMRTTRLQHGVSCLGPGLEMPPTPCSTLQSPVPALASLDSGLALGPEVLLSLLQVPSSWVRPPSLPGVSPCVPSTSRIWWAPAPMGGCGSSVHCVGLRVSPGLCPHPAGCGLYLGRSCVLAALPVCLGSAWKGRLSRKGHSVQAGPE